MRVAFGFIIIHWTSDHRSQRPEDRTTEGPICGDESARPGDCFILLMPKYNRPSLIHFVPGGRVFVPRSYLLSNYFPASTAPLLSSGCGLLDALTFNESLLFRVRNRSLHNRRPPLPRVSKAEVKLPRSIILKDLFNAD